MYVIETALDRVEAVALSGEGRLAAVSATGEWMCEVWNLPPNPDTVWQELDDEPFAFGLAFEPGTGLVVYGDAKDGLKVNDDGDVCGLEVPGGPLRAFAFRPDGKWLVCGCERWDNPSRPKLNAPSRPRLTVREAKTLRALEEVSHPTVHRRGRIETPTAKPSRFSPNSHSAALLDLLHRLDRHPEQVDAAVSHPQLPHLRHVPGGALGGNY